MKELTFREVIANIKEGEVWEGEGLIVYLRGNELNIDWKNGYEDVGVNICLNEKFILQREKVRFQEAFKAYEEGKEIESRESGYKYYNDEGKCYIQAPEGNDWTRWVEDTFELKEIRGEWYIN